MNVGLCVNGRCRNTEGSFVCECADGYTLTPDGEQCRDINECSEVSQFMSGVCLSLVIDGLFVLSLGLTNEVHIIFMSCKLVHHYSYTLLPIDNKQLLVLVY